MRMNDAEGPETMSTNSAQAWHKAVANGIFCFGKEGCSLTARLAGRHHLIRQLQVSGRVEQGRPCWMGYRDRGDGVTETSHTTCSYYTDTALCRSHRKRARSTVPAVTREQKASPRCPGLPTQTGGRASNTSRTNSLPRTLAVYP